MGEWCIWMYCILDVLIWFDSLHLDAGVGISLIAYDIMYPLCVMEHSLAWYVT